MCHPTQFCLLCLSVLQDMAAPAVKMDPIGLTRLASEWAVALRPLLFVHKHTKEDNIKHER